MSDFGTILSSDAVRFERLLPGPIDRIWAFLTESDRLATWLTPATIELREGGRIELHFDRNPPELTVADCAEGGPTIGTVTRYEPPHVLAYSWCEAVAGASAAPGAESVVTFELEAQGERVRLRLTHRRLAVASLPHYGAGWHTHLDVLVAHLTDRKPPAFAALFHELHPDYASRVAQLSVAA